MRYSLTEFDFSDLSKPWWLEVEVKDPGILTVSNSISHEERLYEVGEYHTELSSIQEAILEAIHNFTDTHIPPNPGNLDILSAFEDTHNGVSLSFQKDTGMFLTIHELSGMVIKHYSLVDLFILGPSIITRDGDAYDLMLQQGMV